MTAEIEEVVPLSLDQLVLGENIRCELKPYTIKHLAEQIKEAGRIHTALKVEPHGNGTYMIREGYRRYAAALYLEEQGITIPLPCIIEPVTATRRERILKQLSENHDRDNLSPLEKSKVIHMLLEEDMPRAEIMQRFARPAGQGKARTMVPMSEAAYSYHLRYRELPAELQDMLHHGTLQITAANRLLDEKDPEKRAQLLIDAEQKRQERVAREEPKDQHLEKLETEHAKYLAALAQNHKILEAKNTEIGTLETELAQKKTISDAAFKGIGNLKGDKKEAAEKIYRAAAVETKQVRNRLLAAQQEKRKAQKEIKRGAKRANLTGRKVEVVERTEKKRTALSEKDVRAAMIPKNHSGRARLGAVDMRAAVEQWSKGPYIRVKLIAGIIQKTFDSVLTAGQALRELAKVTGEERKRRR